MCDTYIDCVESALYSYLIKNVKELLKRDISINGDELDLICMDRRYTMKKLDDINEIKAKDDIFIFNFHPESDDERIEYCEDLKLTLFLSSEKNMFGKNAILTISSISSNNSYSSPIFLDV